MRNICTCSYSRCQYSTRLPTIKIGWIRHCTLKISLHQTFSRQIIWCSGSSHASSNRVVVSGSSYQNLHVNILSVIVRFSFDFLISSKSKWHSDVVNLSSSWRSCLCSTRYIISWYATGPFTLQRDQKLQTVKVNISTRSRSVFDNKHTPDTIC